MFTQTAARALSRLGLDQRGTDPHPRRFSPMLLTKADAIFSSPDWIYEPKFDGFRVLASVRDGFVDLVSRNGHSFTRLFGPISDALKTFPVPIVLDGEVVAVTKSGRPDFEALQARLRPRNGKLPGHLCYMVFDCLYLNGQSLLRRPLEGRQEILRNLQPSLRSAVVQLTEHFPAEQSEALVQACRKIGHEGVVMKRRTSLYRTGLRSPDWRKVAFRHREEFVVAGYLPSARGFYTLLLGQYDRRGNLNYVGSCGTGLSGETRSALVEELKRNHRKIRPFRQVPILRGDFRKLPNITPQWVKPKAVAEVEYRQRLSDGLRHATLRAIRPVE